MPLRGSKIGPSPSLPIPVRVLQEATMNRCVCQVEMTTGYIYDGTLDEIDEHQNMTLLDATCQSIRLNHLRSIRTKGVMPKRYVGTVLLNGSQVVMLSIEEIPEGLISGFRNAVKGVKKELALRKQKNRLERKQRMTAKAATSSEAAPGVKKTALSPVEVLRSRGRSFGRGRGRGK